MNLKKLQNKFTITRVNQSIIVNFSRTFPKHMTDFILLIVFSFIISNKQLELSITTENFRNGFIKYLEGGGRYLNIVLVSRYHLSSDTKYFNVSPLTSLSVTKIHYAELFEHPIMKHLLISERGGTNDIIFIFTSISWMSLILEFRKINVIVSGGSNTKRHLLSSLQLRLAHFIICFINSVYSSVKTSFHHKFTMDNNQPSVDLTSDKAIKEYLDSALELTSGSDIKEENAVQNTSSGMLKGKGQKTNNLLSNNIIKREFHTTSLALEKKTTDSSVNTQIYQFMEDLKDLVNNPNISNVEKQRTIEDNWINMITDKFNSGEFLNNDASLLAKGLKKSIKSLDLMYNKGELHKRLESFDYDKLNSAKFLFIAFSLVLQNYNKFGLTVISSIVGKHILFQLYKDYKKSEKKTSITFEKYSSGIEPQSVIKLGYFYINILVRENIFDVDFETNKSSFYTESISIIKLNPKYIESITNDLIIHPSSLPMLCKPVEWNDSNFGGALSNKEQHIDLITGSTANHNHKIENRNSLYKAVNTINSIEFVINNLLLEYLLNEGKYLLEGSQDDKVQNSIALKMAEVLSSTVYYIHTHADWRGRIYTQSFYINYQGNDLSTALVNFHKGESLTKTGKKYLYIYGANNYNENNISKACYTDRIKWVDNNYDKIISMDSDFILKAENKFIFTAFCLVMRELHKDPNCKVALPVFLDATCSGIQHLAGLLRDFNLGSKVNLIPQSDNDVVGDIYSDMLDYINRAINRFGLENEGYAPLSLVKLNRSLIKQPIMTKTYNVTVYGMSHQLQEKLKVGKKFICPTINGGTINLTHLHIYKIAEIINEQIFTLFPALNDIYNYFIDITKLMVILNIPIYWFTPAGLKITQHYLKSKKNVIAISFFGRTKKLVLREYTNLMDKNKQSQGIIPNIIHSLDATHLINIINKGSDQGLNLIIPVHDCFGSLPNKIAELEFLVKKEFVELYTQANFLEKFHNRMIQTIKDNNFCIDKDSTTNNIFVTLDNKYKYYIPNLPKLDNLDLNKIVDSKYMIT